MDLLSGLGNFKVGGGGGTPANMAVYKACRILSVEEVLSNFNSESLYEKEQEFLDIQYM